MKSLLEKGDAKDARELMALFITAFQGNIALTMHNFIFHMANNPEIQETLHKEILEAKNAGDFMTAA